MRGITQLACAIVAALALFAGSRGEPPPKKVISIGDRLGNLTFKDIHYLPRSLADFPKARAFVLVFTNTTCPVVQRYLPVLQAMEKDHRARGVQFVAISTPWSRKRKRNPGGRQPFLMQQIPTG
jgi:thiol-disulfide isomerase/thioredoxin